MTDKSAKDATARFSKRVASVDVDSQKTFTPLCPNELPVPDGHLIAKALNEIASLADYRVMTKDAHAPNAVWVVDKPEQMLQPLNLPDADLTWVAHAVPGTEGFELLDELPAPRDYDFCVYKGVEPDMHPYGACYHDTNEKISTGLIEWLRQQQVETVLVGGLAYDYCVKFTAIQLAKAGFRTIVTDEACRGIAAETMQIAQEEMLSAGVEICQKVGDIPLLLNVSRQGRHEELV